VLQVIISKSMRRIQNMFRQKFCEFQRDIRWYHWFSLGLSRSGQSHI